MSDKDNFIDHDELDALEEIEANSGQPSDFDQEPLDELDELDELNEIEGLDELDELDDEETIEAEHDLDEPGESPDGALEEETSRSASVRASGHARNRGALSDTGDEEIGEPSFLSTSSGKIVAIAGTLGLLAALGGGYVLFIGGSGVPAPQPTASQQMSFPGSGPGTGATPGSTEGVQVLESQGEAPSSSVQQPSLGFGSDQPEDGKAGIPSLSEPVGSTVGTPEILEEPAPKPKAAQAQPGAPESLKPQSPPLSDPLAVSAESDEGGGVRNPSETPVAAPGATGLSADEIRSIIEEVVSSHVDDLKGERAEDSTPPASADAIADIQEGVSAIQGSINGLKARTVQLSERLSAVDTQLNEIVEARKREAEQARKAEEEAKRAEAQAASDDADEAAASKVTSAPEQLYHHLIGRRRLEAFNVINASDDGKFSIVRTPSNRVNVYFKGETFMVPGRTMTVTHVLAGGELVLATDDRGEKWFIDSFREPRAEDERDSSVRATDGAAAKPGPAEGWSLNAVFESGYLVKGPHEQFVSVKKGDSIEGLGQVIGLDPNGNLKVGEHTIQAVRD
jgi:hypothetical protein